MKKVLGPFISILTGVLSIIILSVYHLTTKIEGVLGGETNSSAWDLVKNADKDVEGSVFFKVMTIILVVVAAILIVYGFIYLLANLKAIKIKANLKVVNDILLLFLVAVIVVQLVALFQVANALTVDAIIEKSTAIPAVGIWLNLGLAVVACLASIFFTKSVKSKKR